MVVSFFPWMFSQNVSGSWAPGKTHDIPTTAIGEKLFMNPTRDDSVLVNSQEASSIQEERVDGKGVKVGKN